MNVVVAVVEASVKLVEAKYRCVHVTVYVHVIVLQRVPQLLTGVFLDFSDGHLRGVPGDPNCLCCVVYLYAVINFWPQRGYVYVWQN